MASLIGVSPSAGHRMIAASISLITLTSITVTLRCWVRIYMLRSFGVDDWLLLATQILFIAQCSQIIWAGVVTAEQDTMSYRSQMQAFGSISYTFQSLYLMTQVFLKIALAAFFLRIVCQKWQRNVIIVTVVAFAILEVVSISLTLFQCGLPSWKTSFSDPHAPGCISATLIVAIKWTSVAANCITDWILVTITAMVVFRLKLRPAARCSAGALVLVGLLGSIASVVRIPLTEVGTLESKALIACIESGLGIIALSLAALRPLLSKLLNGFFGSTVGLSLQYNGVREIDPQSKQTIHNGSALLVEHMTDVHPTRHPLRANKPHFSVVAVYSEETGNIKESQMV